jgi:hypothetical protein
LVSKKTKEAKPIPNHQHYIISLFQKRFVSFGDRVFRQKVKVKDEHFQRNFSTCGEEKKFHEAEEVGTCFLFQIFNWY